jgi:hypothetical protein
VQQHAQLMAHPLLHALVLEALEVGGDSCGVMGAGADAAAATAGPEGTAQARDTSSAPHCPSNPASGAAVSTTTTPTTQDPGSSQNNQGCLGGQSQRDLGAQDLQLKCNTPPAGIAHPHLHVLGAVASTDPCAARQASLPTDGGDAAGPPPATPPTTPQRSASAGPRCAPPPAALSAPPLASPLPASSPAAAAAGASRLTVENRRMLMCPGGPSLLSTDPLIHQRVSMARCVCMGHPWAVAQA